MSNVINDMPDAYDKDDYGNKQDSASMCSVANDKLERKYQRNYNNSVAKDKLERKYQRNYNNSVAKDKLERKYQRNYNNSVAKDKLERKYQRNYNNSVAKDKLERKYQRNYNNSVAKDKLERKYQRNYNNSVANDKLERKYQRNYNNSTTLDYIIGGFARYQRLQSSNDDDAIDRLNHIYTVTLLVVLSIFVSGKQYVGNAIECFCATQEFDLAKREYVRTYCWLKNTYKVKKSEPFPVDKDQRVQEEIAYYQWVPIILLVMAILFKLPNLLWRVFSYNSGMDLNQVASLVINSQLGPSDKSKETMRQVAEYIDRWLEGHREFSWNAVVRTKKYLSKRCCFFCFWGKRFGTYLTGLYLLTKFLFVAIDIVVFLILQRVLGKWYIPYGFNLLTSVAEDSPSGWWNESPYFPKVTFCDVDMWQMSNVITYTVQCTLPINMFNEKIFAFLWFWMFLVTTATVINFLFWVYKWALGGLKYIYNVKKFLKAKGEIITEYDRNLVSKFGRQYLRRDGAFVLFVIFSNSNEVVMADLVSELWHIYKNKPLTLKDKSQGDVMYI